MKTNISNKFKGFTIIELITVLAIVGILAVIGTPLYNKYKLNSEQKAEITIATEFQKKIKTNFLSQLNYSQTSSGIPQIEFVHKERNWQAPISDCPNLAPIHETPDQNANQIISQWKNGEIMCMLKMRSCRNRTSGEIEVYLDSTAIPNACINLLSNDPENYEKNLNAFVAYSHLNGKF